MPINPNIALQVRQPEIESPLNALAKVSQVQNAMNQNRLFDMQVAERQQKQQRQNALMQATRNAFDPSTGTLDPNKYRSSLAEFGDYEGLQSFEKSLAEQRKAGAEADYKMAQTGEINIKTLNAKLQQQRDVLNMVNDPQSAARWLTAAWSDPDVGAVMRRTGKTLEQAMSEIPSDPAEFQKWKMRSSLGAEKLVEYTTPNANTVANNQTSRANNAATVEATIRGQDLAEARARRAEPTYDPARGIIVSKDGVARQVVGPGGTPIGPKQTINMSATMQKELFESDDVVQASKNAIGLLNQALTLNDKAYSGVGAKTRATIASNLPGKESEAANATIELDNIIGGQALESLKAIFGGMPTEGERKVLLDLQASSDKTPTQRKAIIDRAIAAAEKRMKFNEQKARSIRTGAYNVSGPGYIDTDDSSTSTKDQGKSSLDDIFKSGNPLSTTAKPSLNDIFGN